MKTITINHPTQKGGVMVINAADFDPAKHTMAAEIAKPEPKAEIRPAPTDLKAKVLVYDKGLATGEGIKSLTNKDEWPNARAKELAVILGLKPGMTESGDSIRKKNLEAVTEIMKG